MVVHSYCKEFISVKEITNNDYYKISRNLKNAELAASIKNSGMLEKPFLVKHNDSFYPLTCHNRISIISELNIEGVEAFILEAPSYEVFIRNLLLKIYRNECGPIGRIKAVKIVQNEFGISGTSLTDLSRKTLKIPNEIFSDEKVLNRIMGLPESLKDYIDAKDIPFKIIRDMVLFDDNIISELNRWIEKVQIRLNIFKMLVDFLFDIKKRDGHFKAIEDDILAKMDDKALYDYVFRIRYPEYSEKKIKADSIITFLTGHGVSIDYPEFFEKDTISFRLTINRKDTGGKVASIASGLDVKKIDELLSLL
jgi:hypothetical protein